MDKILSFCDLSIGYRRGNKTNTILSSLSEEICHGELIALIGPNGVGKSTLLRTLTELLPALSGQINLNGRSLKSYSRAELAKIIGFVNTANPVSGNLTVIELVALGRFPYTNWIGHLKERDREVINNSVESVGLSKQITRRFGELSDGERQRAMIARALAQEPQLLVLDEPTAFIDLPGRYELIHILKKLVSDNNKSVVFSSHDLQIALREADKVWLMTPDGITGGSPEDLILDGSFFNLFPGSPLVFDESDSGFYYPVKGQMSIRFEGEGRITDITRKTLARLNIIVTKDKDAPLLNVREGKNGRIWTINIKKRSDEFSSLYELARFIRNISGEK